MRKSARALLGSSLARWGAALRARYGWTARFRREREAGFADWVWLRFTRFLAEARSIRGDVHHWNVVHHTSPVRDRVREIRTPDVSVNPGTASGGPAVFARLGSPFPPAAVPVARAGRDVASPEGRLAGATLPRLPGPQGPARRPALVAPGNAVPLRWAAAPTGTPSLPSRLLSGQRSPRSLAGAALPPPLPPSRSSGAPALVPEDATISGQVRVSLDGGGGSPRPAASDAPATPTSTSRPGFPAPWPTPHRWPSALTRAGRDADRPSTRTPSLLSLRWTPSSTGTQPSTPGPTALRGLVTAGREDAGRTDSLARSPFSPAAVPAGRVRATRGALPRETPSAPPVPELARLGAGELGGLPLVHVRAQASSTEAPEARARETAEGARIVSETIRRQVEETVERTLVERVETLVSRGLAGEALPLGRIAEKVQAELSESLALERERQGWS